MAIHIKESHRGRFTAYKKRTGKTTEEALHSKNPHVRAMANFARNARKWKHEFGGALPMFQNGTDQYNLFPTTTPSLNLNTPITKDTFSSTVPGSFANTVANSTYTPNSIQNVNSNSGGGSGLVGLISSVSTGIGNAALSGLTNRAQSNINNSYKEAEEGLSPVDPNKIASEQYNLSSMQNWTLGPLSLLTSLGARRQAKDQAKEFNKQLEIKKHNLTGQNALASLTPQASYVNVAKQGGYTVYKGQTHENSPIGGIPTDEQGNPSGLSKNKPIALTEKNEVARYNPDNRSTYIYSHKLGFAKPATSLVRLFKLDKDSWNNLYKNDILLRTAIDKQFDNLTTAQEFAKETESPYDQTMGLLQASKGGNITSSKAKEMLRDGTAHGQKLTTKQKRFFGWIAGGRKELGGPLEDPTKAKVSVDKQIADILSQRLIGGPFQAGKWSKNSLANYELERKASELYKQYYNKDLHIDKQYRRKIGVGNIWFSPSEEQFLKRANKISKVADSRRLEGGPLDEQRDRRRDLYSPILSKASNALDLLTPEEMKTSNVNTNAGALLSLTAMGKNNFNPNVTPDSVFSIPQQRMVKRNTPPMTDTLREIQGVIGNIPEDKMAHLMRDVNMYDIGITDIPAIYKATKDVVKPVKALKYYNYLKGLGKQGYTLERGGELPMYQEEGWLDPNYYSTANMANRFHENYSGKINQNVFGVNAGSRVNGLNIPRLKDFNFAPIPRFYEKEVPAPTTAIPPPVTPSVNLLNKLNLQKNGTSPEGSVDTTSEKTNSWTPWLNPAGHILSSLSNFLDYKNLKNARPTDVRLPRTVAERISLAKQRLANTREAATARAVNASNARNLGTNAGTAYSTIAASNTGVNRLLGQQNAQLLETEVNTNAQLAQQANALNAELAAQEALFNAQQSNAYRMLLAQNDPWSNALKTSASYFADNAKYRRDYDTMQMLAPNAELYKEPDASFWKKMTGQNRKVRFSGKDIPIDELKKYLNFNELPKPKTS